MPLPNTRLIPDRWSEHHQPTANGQMTATGTITRPASATAAEFDEAAGRSVLPEPTIVYSGPMRVQRPSQSVAAQTAAIADRSVTIRDYRVSLPLKHNGADIPAVMANDIVTVTGGGDDPSLIGRPLRVRDTRLNTIAWQRDLMCEDPAATSR